jgi:hypothetical protein
MKYQAQKELLNLDERCLYRAGARRSVTEGPERQPVWWGEKLQAKTGSDREARDYFIQSDCQPR